MKTYAARRIVENGGLLAKDSVLSIIDFAESAEQKIKQLISDLNQSQASQEAAERERDELRAEIARRDAAAGEVIYQFDCGGGWQDVDQTGYERYINARGISTRKVYTAAPPAVLPPEVTEPVGEYCLDDREGLAWLAGANWMRQHCLELGAQQQKVVEIPELQKWRKPDEVRAQSAYRNIIIQLLEAAGVKLEVKK